MSTHQTLEETPDERRRRLNRLAQRTCRAKRRDEERREKERRENEKREKERLGEDEQSSTPQWDTSTHFSPALTEHSGSGRGPPSQASSCAFYIDDHLAMGDVGAVPDLLPVDPMLDDASELTYENWFCDALSQDMQQQWTPSFPQAHAVASAPGQGVTIFPENSTANHAPGSSRGEGDGVCGRSDAGGLVDCGASHGACETDRAGLVAAVHKLDAKTLALFGLVATIVEAD